MSRYMLSAAVVGIFAGFGLGADLKSGLEPGQAVPAFSPLNINGDAAGEKRCQVWVNGNNPVAVVFAREITPGLTSLVKKLEAATAKHSDCKMGAFVVLLTDDDTKAEEKLKALAEKEHLKKVILTIDNPQGPPRYKIAKEADVTVLLYTKKKVEKNFAFEKGKLTDAEVDAVVTAVKDILPEKKEK